MEILINNKWLKVDYTTDSNSRIRRSLSFIDLETKEKLILEELFDKMKSLPSKEYKFDTILIDDSKFFSLKGVFVCGIGDCSKDFIVGCDAVKLIEVDILSVLNNVNK